MRNDAYNAAAGIAQRNRRLLPALALREQYDLTSCHMHHMHITSHACSP